MTDNGAACSVSLADLRLAPAGDKIGLVHQVLCAIDASVRSGSLSTALQQAVPLLLDCQSAELHFTDGLTRQRWAPEAKASAQAGLPLSKGIIGFVAMTGQMRNIPAAGLCKYFDTSMDGEDTETTLCCPVCDVYGTRVAVLQAVNKRQGRFLESDEQMLLTCCSHLGNVLSLSQLRASAMTDQQRMAVLCKGLQRLQCSPDLNATCINIIRAADELLQAQHLLLLLVDQANDHLWTQWYARTLNMSQGLTMVMQRPKSGRLALAVQHGKRSVLQDVLPNSMAPGFDRIFGSEALEGAILQPIIHQAGLRSTLAVLVVVNSTRAHSVAAQDTNAASDRAVLDVLAMEAAHMLAAQREDISVAAALAAFETFRTTDPFMDHILQAHMLTYVLPRATSHEVASPWSQRSRASCDNVLSNMLPIEQLDSWSLNPEQGPGLLDSLCSSPSTRSIVQGVKDPPAELLQNMQQQSYALSAWYSRELRDAAECSDRVAHAPKDKVALPALASLQQNAADAKAISVAVAKARDRRAMLSGGTVPLRPEPVASNMSAGLTDSELTAPPAPQELLRWEADFLTLSDAEMVDYMFKLFAASGVVEHFDLNQEHLQTFIRGVQALHHDNPYHNLWHTCNVLQAAYLIMSAVQEADSETLSKAAILAVLIAALCHDLDHDGRTNSFHVAVGTEWAQRYNDVCVMEMHHCATAFALLNGSELLRHLDVSVQQDIRRMVIGAVLATDISQHFSVTSQFCLHGGFLGDLGPEELVLLCKTIVHAADVSNPARPFPIYAVMAQSLHQEYLAQSLEERALGLESLPHMESGSQVAQCQVEACFIHAIALPLWRHLAACFPALACAVLRMEHNFHFYCMLSRLDEAEIVEVYKLAEHDRTSKRLGDARWTHGEGQWLVGKVKALDLHISSPRSFGSIQEGDD
ncbi:hypothetical protein WJX73_009976 [Symbiochloris irregularis]|uniref:Phosphodiesterase n=1 Tax=Symbiochloris irregularis TaxID=706552 RepID=A0AAW1PNW5_9CHLO